MTESCEVCGSTLDGPVIDLGQHPLNDDMQPVGSNQSVTRYAQEVHLCSVCLTAHQLHPVAKETLFFPEYRYRGSVTKDVLSGMQDLVENSLAFLGRSGPITVLDIGANDGSLLGTFKSSIDCKTIGVDPTLAVLNSEGRIDFPYMEFFSEDTANKILTDHGAPDVVTFTNVFAHIEDLPALTRATSHLLTDENLLVIENHYLGSVLDRNQFDTFYAEHLRTYSAESFRHIAGQLDAEIRSIQFPRRYGGNIRVYMSRRQGAKGHFDPVSESDFVGRFAGIQGTYDMWRADASQTLTRLLSAGPLIGKSCPARSVMLYSSLDMTREKMPRVYEHPRSPKIGFCVPGTDISIVSDDGLREESIDQMILWSWHIAYELMPYLAQTGWHGDVWAPLPTFEKIGSI